MCLRVKHYTFAGKNMILKGNSPLSQDEQFRLQLVELKEQVEQKLQSLLRHLTLIDSTVLGILSAFHDERSGCTYTHLLPVAGSALLFLSLLSGLYCMWQGYRTSQKSLTRLFRAYSERNFPPFMDIYQPRRFTDSLPCFAPYRFAWGFYPCWQDYGFSRMAFPYVIGLVSFL